MTSTPTQRSPVVVASDVQEGAVVAADVQVCPGAAGQPLPGEVVATEGMVGERPGAGRERGQFVQPVGQFPRRRRLGDRTVPQVDRLGAVDPDAFPQRGDVPDGDDRSRRLLPTEVLGLVVVAHLPHRARRATAMGTLPMRWTWRTVLPAWVTTTSASRIRSSSSAGVRYLRCGQSGTTVDVPVWMNTSCSSARADAARTRRSKGQRPIPTVTRTRAIRTALPSGQPCHQ